MSVKINNRFCSDCKYAPLNSESVPCKPCVSTASKPNWEPSGEVIEAQAMGEPLPAVRGNQLPEDDAVRGQYPMAEGCLDYFPNALAEVSRISFEGNQKHNPGQPMHWARGKSTDHRNKIIRHTVDSRDDTEAAIEHAAQAAWRALALLQEKIEKVRGVQVSGASK